MGDKLYPDDDSIGNHCDKAWGPDSMNNGIPTPAQVRIHFSDVEACPGGNPYPDGDYVLDQVPAIPCKFTIGDADTFIIDLYLGEDDPGTSCYFYWYLGFIPWWSFYSFVFTKDNFELDNELDYCGAGFPVNSSAQSGSVRIYYRYPEQIKHMAYGMNLATNRAMLYDITECENGDKIVRYVNQWVPCNCLVRFKPVEPLI